MTEAEAAERIRDLIVGDLRWPGPREELTDDLPLIERRVIDSLRLLHLVARLEAVFGIPIRDEEIVPATFGTIGSLAAFVAARAETGAD
jgi:acyl carrier protein